VSLACPFTHSLVVYFGSSFIRSVGLRRVMASDQHLGFRQ
jgi:hypothetical protein